VRGFAEFLAVFVVLLLGTMMFRFRSGRRLAERHDIGPALSVSEAAEVLGVDHLELERLTRRGVFRTTSTADSGLRLSKEDVERLLNRRRSRPSVIEAVRRVWRRWIRFPT